MRNIKCVKMCIYELFRLIITIRLGSRSAGYNSWETNRTKMRTVLSLMFRRSFKNSNHVDKLLQAKVFLKNAARILSVVIKSIIN